MDINANDKTIGSVLSGGFYRVPDFQRAYSWDSSNVEALWDDIIESEDDYFIGAMVIFSDGDVAGLVDGQQRLTTITMMLAALRNEFSLLEAFNQADGVHTLIERQDPKGKARFVLRAETSYPYLQAGIQALPGAAQPVASVGSEDRSLKAAFQLITQKTQSIRLAVEADESVSSSRQKAAALKALEAYRDKVYGLNVVVIEVGSEDDATTIFQTLNSRGKDLETADLVKAHLLKILKAPNAGLTQTRDAWEQMRQSFDDSDARIDMNRFLLHTWLSRQEYVGEKDLFSQIKKRVRVNNAQEYLDNWVADAERYRTIQEPTFRTWTKSRQPIAGSLDAMRLFRLQQPLPFVLAILREYDAKHVKLADVLAGLQGVERFHFMSTAVVNQPSSGGISKMYAAAARAVLEAAGRPAKKRAIDDLLDKLRARIPTYAEFEAAFVELRSSRQYKQQTPLVRYVLNGLHVSTVPGSSQAVDLSQLTVEHLAPQGEKRPSGIPPEDVAKIGNLLFVSEQLNQSLEDKPFSEKQKLLRNELGIEPEVVEASVWGSAEIHQRSQRLAHAAYHTTWKF